jgi:hypothetical protein
MSKNELVAKFYGCKLQHNPTHFGGRDVYWSPTSSDGKTRTFFAYADELHFDSDRNWQHEAWIKFRDLKFEKEWQREIFHQKRETIEGKILYGTITEAFDELVRGIEWVESLKNKNVPQPS